MFLLFLCRPAATINFFKSYYLLMYTLKRSPSISSIVKCFTKVWNGTRTFRNINSSFSSPLMHISQEQPSLNDEERRKSLRRSSANFFVKLENANSRFIGKDEVVTLIWHCIKWIPTECIIFNKSGRNGCITEMMYF